MYDFKLNDADCEQKYNDICELLGNFRINEFCEKYNPNGENNEIEVYKRCLCIARGGFDYTRVGILNHLYIIYRVYKKDFSRVFDVLVKNVTFSYGDFGSFFKNFFNEKDDVITFMDDEHAKSSFLSKLFNSCFDCKRLDIFKNLLAVLDNKALYHFTCYVICDGLISGKDKLELLKLFFRRCSTRGNDVSFYKNLINLFICVSGIDAVECFNGFISDNNLCNIENNDIICLILGDTSSINMRVCRFKKFLDYLIGIDKGTSSVVLRGVLDSNGYIGDKTVSENFNLDCISFIFSAESAMTGCATLRYYARDFRSALNKIISSQSFLWDSDSGVLNNIMPFLRTYKGICERNDNFENFAIMNCNAEAVQQYSIVVGYIKKCMEKYRGDDDSFFEIVCQIIKSIHNNAGLLVGFIRFLGSTMEIERLDKLNERLNKFFSYNDLVRVSFNNDQNEVYVFHRINPNDIFYKKMFIKDVFDDMDFVKLGTFIQQHVDKIFERNDFVNQDMEFKKFLDRYIKFSNDNEKCIYFSDFYSLFAKYPERILNLFVSYCTQGSPFAVCAVIMVDFRVDNEDLRRYIKEILIDGCERIVRYGCNDIKIFYSTSEGHTKPQNEYQIQNKRFRFWPW